jgi:hypothetical protein
MAFTGTFLNWANLVSDRLGILPPTIAEDRISSNEVGEVLAQMAFKLADIAMKNQELETRIKDLEVLLEAINDPGPREFFFS